MLQKYIKKKIDFTSVFIDKAYLVASAFAKIIFSVEGRSIWKN